MPLFLFASDEPVHRDVGRTLVHLGDVGSLSTFEDFILALKDDGSNLDHYTGVGVINGGTGAFAGASGRFTYRADPADSLGGPPVANWSGRGTVCDGGR